MNICLVEKEVPQINAFGTAYIHHFHSVQSFFHYHPYEHKAYEKRVDDVLARSYRRTHLAQVIKQYVSQWKVTKAMETSLSKLEQPNSVVVIGGQQAGLLTGPLYTLHKAITIITLAKQKEDQLNVPVVPIFWVAGEDHDFQEINHTYLARKDSKAVDKLMAEDDDAHKKMSSSHRQLPKEQIVQWLDKFFEKQPTTEFTETLYNDICSKLNQSQSYTDFFTSMMIQLFGDYGLLFIDSAYEELRKLETPFFKSVIKHYESIDEDVRSGHNVMQSQGFDPQIQVSEAPALLFIYENNERLLLEKVDGQFQTKDGRFHYSEAQLLSMAEEQPWRLSNNVVTRPFMQECLFPTLAFVGGPGEIAYWALYKKYFERFEMKLPILAPRMSMTLIEKPIANILEKRAIDIMDVYSRYEQMKEEWLEAQDEQGLKTAFEEVKQDIEALYKPLIQKISDVQSGLHALGEKNMSKVLEQVQYLEKRTTQALKSQHEAALRQFDKVEQALYPHHQFQERVYNPFVFFNKHGYDLIDDILHLNLCINGKHKLLYLHAENEKDSERSS